MQTKWQWSVKTESERIIYACANLANGFYRHEGYLVLPVDYDSPSPGNTVYLPNLGYSSIPRFWSKVSRINMTTLNPQESKKLLPAISTKISMLNAKPVANPEIERIWSKYSGRIYAEICHILNRSLNDIKTITINWSRYGTVASFAAPTRFPSDVTLYLRQDQGIRTLVEALVTSIIFHPLIKKHNATWKHVKLMSDWVVQDSSLAELLKKIDPMPYESTLRTLSKSIFDTDVIKVAERYQQKIGAPIPLNLLSYINGKVVYKSQPLLHLTSREVDLLKKLISVSPKVVTNDEIADVIFTKTEEFSLQVITKTVEHLRNKLEINGIPGSRIKTHYSQGYSLQ